MSFAFACAWRTISSWLTSAFCDAHDGLGLALCLADDLGAVCDDGLRLAHFGRDRLANLIKDLLCVFAIYKRFAACKGKVPAFLQYVGQFIN